MRALNRTIVLTALAVGPALAAPRYLSVRHDHNFADTRAQMQVLVDVNGHDVKNRLCIVGEKIGSYTQAIVYWQNESKLILWEPQIDNPKALLTSRRYLDLKRDVVEGDDVGGSTYLMTRADVNAEINACRAHGDTYTVTRNPDHG